MIQEKRIYIKTQGFGVYLLCLPSPAICISLVLSDVLVFDMEGQLDKYPK